MQERPIKDVTDLRTHYRDEGFLNLLADLQGKARLIDKGVDIEAYTMAELEQQYIIEGRIIQCGVALPGKLAARTERPSAYPRRRLGHHRPQSLTYLVIKFNLSLFRPP